MTTTAQRGTRLKSYDELTFFFIKLFKIRFDVLLKLENEERPE